jgi:hypothetical protein
VTRRLATGVVLGLLMGAAWVAIAAAVPPLRVTCAPDMPRDVCLETADAGLRRGMPRLHPLITEAAVGPGPAFPAGHGHRATVRYTLVPGPLVTERLFVDAAGHWGVVPDHAEIAIGSWALLPVLLMTCLGGAMGVLADRRAVRGRAAP